LTGHINPDGSKNAAAFGGGYRYTADDGMTKVLCDGSREGNKNLTTDKRN